MMLSVVLCDPCNTMCSLWCYQLFCWGYLVFSLDCFSQVLSLHILPRRKWISIFVTVYFILYFHSNLHIYSQLFLWSYLVIDHCVLISAQLYRFYIRLVRPGHDVKLHPHFHCHWYLFVLMCREAGQSAFLHTQLYLSTNLDHILFSNVSWH